MIKKILAILATIGSVFSAIFYVLMKQARTERKLEEVENEKDAALRREEQTEVIRKAENEVHKSIAQQEAEDEKLVERFHSSDNLSGFNAGIDLLRKHSERGDKRSPSAGSAGA